MADDSVVYTVNELAEYWRVNSQTVYRMVRSGRLQSFKVGAEYRITDRAVRDYEDGRVR